MQVVDAIKDLVQDCNFDCNDSGIALQAMDNSHVALVSMMLRSEAFSPFRCDRNIALGINLGSLTKVLRAAQSEDILTLKAEDAPDVVNLVFENSSSDRISEYDIKLMDIDQEHLGIPETEYAATITMPAAEFQRICRDLSALSESGALYYTGLARGVKCQRSCVEYHDIQALAEDTWINLTPLFEHGTPPLCHPERSIVSDQANSYQCLLSVQRRVSSSLAKVISAPARFSSGSTATWKSPARTSRLT
jgi:hypothetical protein